MSVRTAIIQFLEAAVAAAVSPTHPLHGLEVNDTPAEKFTANRGVVVFFPRFNLAPNIDRSIKEVDGEIELLIYSRVRGGGAKDARRTADDQASAIALAIAQLFFEDPSVNGSVCDALCTNGEGGWDAEDSQPYQLIGLLVRYNQIGPVIINS